MPAADGAQNIVPTQAGAQTHQGAISFASKLICRHTDLTGFAMRYLLSLPVIGLATVLSGCGGSHTSTPTTSVPPVLTYSIGGNIAGLSGTVVLQNNGGDNLALSRNGSFAFNVTLQPNSPYDVTIATQPAGQVCSVSNGSDTASASVTTILVTCSLSSAATDVWTWVGGSDFVNASGVYGTQGDRKSVV